MSLLVRIQDLITSQKTYLHFLITRSPSKTLFTTINKHTVVSRARLTVALNKKDGSCFKLLHM